MKHINCVSIGNEASQEVRHLALEVTGLRSLPFNGVEDLKLLLHGRSHVQDRCHVATPVAVVRRRPNCHQIAVFKPILKPVHHQLVRTRHQVQPVDVVKLRSYLVAEEPPSTSRVDGPSLDICRVAPHQVAEGTLVGHLKSAFKKPDLV